MQKLHTFAPAKQVQSQSPERNNAKSERNSVSGNSEFASNFLSSSLDVLNKKKGVILDKFLKVLQHERNLFWGDPSFEKNVVLFPEINSPKSGILDGSHLRFSHQPKTSLEDLDDGKEID